MRELILARHAESEYNVQGIVNGDPVVACPLTGAGREQARALGRALAQEPVELCAVTRFQRVRETAETALEGRGVPFVVVPELDDPNYGEFEGRALAEYRAWVWEQGPLAAPRDGEHRGAIAGRYASGLRGLLERPEGLILLVAHSLPIAYALDAAEGRPPRTRTRMIGYAQPFWLDAAAVERAAGVLEAWAAEPAF